MYYKRKEIQKNGFPRLQIFKKMIVLYEEKLKCSNAFFFSWNENVITKQKSKSKKKIFSQKNEKTEWLDLPTILVLDKNNWLQSYHLKFVQQTYKNCL